jgi:hypothetical protein
MGADDRCAWQPAERRHQKGTATRRHHVRMGKAVITNGSEQRVWCRFGAALVQLGADLVQPWCKFGATYEGHFGLDLPSEMAILGFAWCSLGRKLSFAARRAVWHTERCEELTITGDGGDGWRQHWWHCAHGRLEREGHKTQDCPRRSPAVLAGQTTGGTPLRNAGQATQEVRRLTIDDRRQTVGAVGPGKARSAQCPAVSGGSRSHGRAHGAGGMGGRGRQRVRTSAARRGGGAEAVAA